MHRDVQACMMFEIKAEEAEEQVHLTNKHTLHFSPLPPPMYACM